MSRRSLLALLALSGCAAPTGAPVGPTVYYPDPPDPPRIQFLGSYSSSEDLEPAPSGLDQLLFGDKRELEDIKAPYGLLVEGGVIYCCDIQRGAVLVLDVAKEILGEFGRKGRGKLIKPINLCLDSDGLFYVADAGRNQVIVFDANREYLREYGPWEGGRAVDVLVHDGEIYVCDNELATVRVLNRESGEVLREYGTGGVPGQFLQSPTNLTMDAEGRLYVVDTIACAVFVYGQDGKLERKVGSPGDIVGQFARPKGLCLDPEHRLFVVDAAFENCQIFSPEGEIMMYFGGPGVEPGSMFLPADVAFSDDPDDLAPFSDLVDPQFVASGLIVTSNLFGPRKINVYALGRSRVFQYPEDRPAADGGSTAREDGAGE